MVRVCTGREYLNTVLVVLLHGRADGPGTGWWGLVMDCLALVFRMSEPRQTVYILRKRGSAPLALARLARSRCTSAP